MCSLVSWLFCFFQIPMEVIEASNSLSLPLELCQKKKKKELYTDSVYCKFINI